MRGLLDQIWFIIMDTNSCFRGFILQFYASDFTGTPNVDYVSLIMSHKLWLMASGIEMLKIIINGFKNDEDPAL